MAKFSVSPVDAICIFKPSATDDHERFGRRGSVPFAFCSRYHIVRRTHTKWSVFFRFYIVLLFCLFPSFTNDTIRLIVGQHGLRSNIPWTLNGQNVVIRPQKKNDFTGVSTMIRRFLLYILYLVSFIIVILLKINIQAVNCVGTQPLKFL